MLLTSVCSHKVAKPEGITKASSGSIHSGFIVAWGFAAWGGGSLQLHRAQRESTELCIWLFHLRMKKVKGKDTHILS